jgi:hypothetical protein
MDKSVYHDLDIYGRNNTDGTAMEYFDEDAVKTALTLWLTSKKGEFILNPDAGGVLDSATFKNLEGKAIKTLLFRLKNALLLEFVPTIQLVNMIVTPDYEQRVWQVEIQYRNLLTNQIASVYFYSKDLVNIEEQSEEDIEYVGENLRMFCLVKKPDMEGELLVYNDNDLVWKWGLYRFINFSISDPYYNEILAIANM